MNILFDVHPIKDQGHCFKLNQSFESNPDFVFTQWRNERFQQNRKGCAAYSNVTTAAEKAVGKSKQLLKSLNLNSLGIRQSMKSHMFSAH